MSVCVSEGERERERERKREREREREREGGAQQLDVSWEASCIRTPGTTRNWRHILGGVCALVCVCVCVCACLTDNMIHRTLHVNVLALV